MNKFSYIILSFLVCLILLFLITMGTQASSLLQQETPYYPPAQTEQAPTESYPYPLNGLPSPASSTTIFSTPSPATTTSTPATSFKTPTPLFTPLETEPTFINRYATEMAELALSRILPNTTEEFPTRMPLAPDSQGNTTPSDSASKEPFNLSRFGLGAFISLILIFGFIFVFRLLQSGEFRSER